MTEANLQHELMQLFREVLGDHDIALEARTSEADIPGFDSGAKVSLILAIEERFGIRLRSREIDALRDVGDWFAVVHRHVSAAAR